MKNSKGTLSEGDVDPDLLRETVDELVPLVQESLTSDGTGPAPRGGPGPSPSRPRRLRVHETEQQMRQITTAS